MRLVYLYALLTFFSGVAQAYQIESLKVSGGEAAEVRLQAPEAPASLPAPTIKGNVVEIFLPGAELHASFDGQLVLKAPHALIKQLRATPEKKGVMLRLDVTGDTASLKDRLALTRGEQGLLLAVKFPAKPSATVQLAADEQLPVLKAETEVRPASPLFGLRQIFLIFFVFALAGVATFFTVRFLKLKGKVGGQKKYLIEQMAHCPLGAKTGVSLLRVGREFVLVGVTPNQVNLISAMPALQAQYVEETQFERDSFKDAVDEEIERLKKEIAL